MSSSFSYSLLHLTRLYLPLNLELAYLAHFAYQTALEGPLSLGVQEEISSALGDLNSRPCLNSKK